MTIHPTLAPFDHLRSLDTALRLDSLESCFRNKSREAVELREKIEKIREKALFLPPDDADSIEAYFLESELNKLLDQYNVTELYLSVEKPSAPERIAKKTKRISKDLDCILCGSPFKRSCYGSVGVLFVEYKDKDYVIKWCSTHELDGQRIYETILSLLNDPGLKMPESRILDVNLEEDLPPRILPEGGIIAARTKKLLAFAKTPGAPFLDFVESTSYTRLSQPQRELFIRKLGKVMILDYILSNNDRLLRYAYPFSNLGNIMVSEDGTFYLIDNDLSFFKHTSPQDLSTLAAKTIEQISSACAPSVSETIDLTSGDVEKAETARSKAARRNEFLRDLHASRELFTEGARETLAILREHIPGLRIHDPEIELLRRNLETVR